MVQTELARALLGDQTQYTGMARSAVYRWFTDRVSRSVCPEENTSPTDASTWPS